MHAKISVAVLACLLASPPVKAELTINHRVSTDVQPLCDRLPVRPNIVICMVDDLGWNQISVSQSTMGTAKAEFSTPNLEELARDSLRQSLRPLRGIIPRSQQIWHLFINQRLRRETMLSIVKFNSVVEPRLPYLDHELISLLLAAPPAFKLGDEIESHSS